MAAPYTINVVSNGEQDSTITSTGLPEQFEPSMVVAFNRLGYVMTVDNRVDWPLGAVINVFSELVSNLLSNPLGVYMKEGGDG